MANKTHIRSRKNSIELSGTFNLLVQMGFEPSISSKAAELYFNDIESAVNYCSSESDSEITLDSHCILETTPPPGTYFGLCNNILKDKYPQFVNIFHKWFKEEEFEDNQLLDEFIENESYDESFFMQYLEDNYNGHINKHLLETTYNHLVSVINHTNNNVKDSIPGNQLEKTEMKLIDGYIHQLQSEIRPDNGVIPVNIFNVCYKYYADFKLDINEHTIQNDDLYMIRSLYATQCDILCNDILSMNEMYLFAIYNIGIQNNNIPLLTYLLDVYNRYNIQNYKKIIKFESLPYLQRDYKEMNLSKNLWLHYYNHHEFKIKSEKQLTKKCIGLKSQKIKNMCADSIKYLSDGRRISKPTICNNTSMYRINDSICDYSFCIFETFDFVSKYISNIKNINKMPLQFDVWIVPNKVNTIDGEIVKDNINDIDAKLIQNNTKYFAHNGINCKEEGLISDLMYKSTSKLLKNKRNERCCLIIDRRNENNNKLYVYEPPADSRTIQCTNKDTFINESLFNNSMKCLLPSFGGSKQDANGYMFNLSFHCISKYEIRVYLHIDTFGTRFFIQDITDYLQLFFNEKQSKSFKQMINTTTNNQFQKRYNWCKNLLNDYQFDQFYKLILKNKNESPNKEYNF